MAGELVLKDLCPFSRLPRVRPTGSWGTRFAFGREDKPSRRWRGKIVGTVIPNHPRDERYFYYLQASLHDRDFGPVDCDSHCAYQNCAEHDVLSEDVHAEECHPDAHDGDDQCADEGAPNAADATSYRGPPHNDGGYRRQQELSSQGWRTACEAAREDDTRHRRERRRKHEGEDLLPANLHAGSVSCRLSGPDRCAVTAEPCVRLNDVRCGQDKKPDKNDVRQAKGLAGDPRLIGAPRLVERD